MDRQSLEKRPEILVVGSPNVGKRTLLSQVSCGNFAAKVWLNSSVTSWEKYINVLSVGAEVEEVESGKKVLFSDIRAYEVDSGTESRHCFCKAGDLLAVIE